MHYISTIPENKVPEKPIVLQTLLTLGIILALKALFTSISKSIGTIIVVAVPSLLVILVSSYILWVLSQRKTPIGDIKVKVGDKLLPFSATTSEDETFSSNDISGSRTLIKFFRGGWCLYCSVELVQFTEMKPELDKYNVQVIALSGDTVEEAKSHKERDSLYLTILSDPELTVVRQYGVEHHRALGGDTKAVAFSIGGIPFATKFRFKAMSIPTTLLVDENGVIRWIAQSADFRLRASKEEVLHAIKSAFGE